jgi:hypothetical protein
MNFPEVVYGLSKSEILNLKAGDIVYASFSEDPTANYSGTVIENADGKVDQDWLFIKDEVGEVHEIAKFKNHIEDNGTCRDIYGGDIFYISNKSWLS